MKRLARWHLEGDSVTLYEDITDGELIHELTVIGESGQSTIYLPPWDREDQLADVLELAAKAARGELDGSHEGHTRRH